MILVPVLSPSLADPAARAERLAWADGEGFRAFYATTARPLWAFLHASCGEPTLADDLTQESFLRLLAADLDEPSEAGRRAYLYRVASNLLRDHWRQQRRLPEPVASIEDTEMLHGTNHRSPDVGLDVRSALARLTPRDRQLLWLAHVEGLAHREVARILSLGTASVRVLLFRARRRLAAELEAAPERQR